MTKKKFLSALRIAVLVVFIAAVAVLVYGAVLHGIAAANGGRGGHRVSELSLESDRELPQVTRETAAAIKGKDAAEDYRRYDLSGNVDRESEGGAKAAAASAFGEWLRSAACDKNAPAIIEMLNAETIKAKGRAIDLQAAAAKVISEWGAADKEILYTGHYYGIPGKEYVAKFCLAKQRTGASEHEYELDNSSIHEITLYFDDLNRVVAFLPYPEQATSAYGRQYGVR